ncbi:MAG: hypothetical protein ACOH2J_06700 [Allorhizobium sp.]
MAGILGEFISTLVKSVATALSPKKRRIATRKAVAPAKKPKAVAKPAVRGNSKTARVARRTTRRAK